jgi:hypothetical protein
MAREFRNKLLVVTLNTELFWKDHISGVNINFVRIKNAVYIIPKSSEAPSLRSLSTLIKGQVRSRIDYTSSNTDPLAKLTSKKLTSRPDH